MNESLMMFEQFPVFFSQPKIKAITISVCLSFLFVIVPLLRNKVRLRLNAYQRELYDEISSDILVQNCFLFVSVFIYSAIAIVRSDSSFISGDALPFVSLLGALAALWNIRRAGISIKNASSKSNEQRKITLHRIYNKTTTVYGWALAAFIYGLLIVILVSLSPEIFPSWFWFVNFLVTSCAIYVLGWSIALLAVSSEYAKNKKLGSSKAAIKKKV